jgi:glucans biosynthesis protein C
MPSHQARLPWIDHLRTLIIALVVNLHACVTYSHVGDWYLKIDPEPTLAAKVPFILWVGHLQAFFMGLLFFISGYFAHGALQRRGPVRFMRERLLRLGLPALFYMLVIHPFILLVLNPWNFNFGPPMTFYLKYIRSGRFLDSSGPLWFALALLLFCFALVAWRSTRAGRSGADATLNASSESPVASPSAAGLWFFALALGVGTFGMRLVQPIGTSVLNMQLGFFLQYVVFFMCGLHAARHGWLLSLAKSSRARIAGWLAVIGGPVAMLALMVAGSGSGGIQDFFGGWHWQALGYAVWEQFAGVGLSLGLLALFSRKFDEESSRLRWLADRSFAVYVLHAPILVALAMLFRPLPHNMYALIALLTLSGLVTSYLAADLLRRLPLFQAIL